MGTKETSQWEGRLACRAGHLENKPSPCDWSVIGAHEGKHDDAVPEPGVEWHETKRAGPWCCDGVAFGILG